MDGDRESNYKSRNDSSSFFMRFLGVSIYSRRLKS